jgi:hypothetical protein
LLALLAEHTFSMSSIFTMTRASYIALGVLVLIGCSESETRGIKGSPSDVKTAPGVHNGYAILENCQSPSINYGVLGTGSRWYADVAPEDSGRTEALVELASNVFKPALANVGSVDGVGIGTSCTLNAGVSVFMSDWRDVDGVFALVGQALVARDLREEINLHLTVAQPL